MKEESDRIDGRTARRDRNRAAVLDSIIELIEEGYTHPTVAQISERSGVSHRSVFRYFDDLEALFEEAVQLAYQRYGRLAAIHGYTRGSFEERVEALVDQRLTLFPAIAPLAIASRRRVRMGEAVDSVLVTYLGPLRGQLEEHFAQELASMDATSQREVVDSLEVSLSLDAFEYMVRSGRSKSDIAETYRSLLRRLLTS